MSKKSFARNFCQKKKQKLEDFSSLLSQLGTYFSILEYTTFKLHMKLKLLSIMPLSYDDFYDFLIMSPLFFLSFHVKSA